MVGTFLTRSVVNEIQPIFYPHSHRKSMMYEQVGPINNKQLTMHSHINN